MDIRKKYTEVVRLMLVRSDVPLHKIARKTDIPYRKLFRMAIGCEHNMLIGNINLIADAVGMSDEDVAVIAEEIEFGVCKLV